MNRLTEGSNLFWESSRMMLPEHKQCLVENLQSLNKRTKPELDEQEQEELARRIAESLEHKTEIRIRLYDEYADREETGYVVRVDQRRGQVLLQTEHGDEWIDFNEILGVEGSG